MSDVTSLLSRIEAGDPRAAAQLLPLVYDELRKLAAARLVHEKPGQTLSATALVHEAYLRLVGPAASTGLDPPAESGDEIRRAAGTYNSRGHFFAAAAEAMRRILVEQARRKKRVCHGGEFQRIELDSDFSAGDEGDERLLALDEALSRLAEQEPQAAQIVKLRYFAGQTVEEAARSLDISVRTANRHWAYAKAWLFRELK